MIVGATGGSGAQGYGIWVDAGAGYNSITVESTGSIAAASGNAIYATGNAVTCVNNYGTITGNVTLLGGDPPGGPPPPNTILNEPGGSLAPVSAIIGSVINAGT